MIFSSSPSRLRRGEKRYSSVQNRAPHLAPPVYGGAPHHRHLPHGGEQRPPLLLPTPLEKLQILNLLSHFLHYPLFSVWGTSLPKRGGTGYVRRPGQGGGGDKRLRPGQVYSFLEALCLFIVLAHTGFEFTLDDTLWRGSLIKKYVFKIETLQGWIFVAIMVSGAVWKE